MVGPLPFKYSAWAFDCILGLNLVKTFSGSRPLLILLLFEKGKRKCPICRRALKFNQIFETEIQQSEPRGSENSQNLFYNILQNIVANRNNLIPFP
uniref:Uncharacterized protein n=1 Tax=Meloidogyne enterolobii TaxID=390850 RepID=A0A6V7VPX2_MELEN|nr:unnamed protein product [Meloidogyne enterolobii]